MVENNGEPLGGNMENLRNKSVFVTGGGSGLGAAVCLDLAACGARIAVADINNSTAAETAATIVEKGGEAFSLMLDVGDPQAAEAAIAAASERLEGIDILINNAGTDVTVSINELTFSQWDRILKTNLYGPFILSKLCFPVMAQKGAGQIINIVSTAAKRTWANACGYHASKWGFLGLSHALHVEGRKQGIKVTAVISGGLKTPFILDRFPEVDPDVLQDPANVAATVRFVLSLPPESVIPEVMIIPMRETSWP